MARNLARVCCLAVAASFASAHAQACTLSLAAQVPMQLDMQTRHLVVSVTADGTPLTMILDTGAGGILLTQNAAQRVALHQAGIGDSGDTRMGFGSGIGGATAVTALDIERLQIGQTHGAFEAEVATRIFPGQPQRKKDAPPTNADVANGYDGLLGMSVLANFDVDLDLPGQMLRLYHADGDCSHPAVALDQPLYAVPLLSGYMHQVRPVIAVQIGGQTLHALLDSGAPSIVIFQAAAARLGLNAPGKSFTSGGVGGAVTMSRQLVPAITIGPLTFNNVPVAVDPENMPDVDMVLGLQFLHRVHPWFSLSSGNFIMQFPPAPAPTAQ